MHQHSSSGSHASLGPGCMRCREVPVRYTAEAAAHCSPDLGQAACPARRCLHAARQQQPAASPVGATSPPAPTLWSMPSAAAALHPGTGHMHSNMVAAAQLWQFTGSIDLQPRPLATSSPCTQSNSATSAIYASGAASRHLHILHPGQQQRTHLWQIPGRRHLQRRPSALSSLPWPAAAWHPLCPATPLSWGTWAAPAGQLPGSARPPPHA